MLAVRRRRPWRPAVAGHLGQRPDFGDLALRLHEAGMIKATPQKIIAQGTDWRFLNELRRELKG